MDEHDRHTREMREAAQRVAKAAERDLPAAVSAFMKAETDWFNSIPRDGEMRPLERVTGRPVTMTPIAAPFAVIPIRRRFPAPDPPEEGGSE